MKQQCAAGPYLTIRQAADLVMGGSAQRVNETAHWFQVPLNQAVQRPQVRFLVTKRDQVGHVLYGLAGQQQQPCFPASGIASVVGCFSVQW